MRNRFIRRAASAVFAVTLTAGLSACGADSRSSSNGPTALQTASNGDVFNDADVQFATDMIPHHAQAIQMVTLTDGRTLDPQVKALADKIRDAQAPEVEEMSTWLTDWGKDVPATTMDHANAPHDDGMSGMAGSDMPSMSGMDDMPGMMSAEDMTALAQAPDSEFQTMWLQMMIEHHTGAIEMAKTEQRDGSFADAKRLAASIISSQQAEIDTMKGLLN